MPRKKRKKKSDNLGIALNAAITFSGIILLGFIYSFSQNQLHDGIEIKPIISNTSSQPILAKDIYIQNPIKNIKEIQLDVYSKNKSALKAYEKLGFNPDLLKMRLGDFL